MLRLKLNHVSKRGYWRIYASFGEAYLATFDIQTCSHCHSCSFGYRHRFGSGATLIVASYINRDHGRIKRYHSDDICHKPCPNERSYTTAMISKDYKNNSCGLKMLHSHTSIELHRRCDTFSKQASLPHNAFIPTIMSRLHHSESTQSYTHTMLLLCQKTQILLTTFTPFKIHIRT